MVSTQITSPPYFDLQALRVELTDLYKEYKNPDACRPAVLKLLKRLTNNAHASARAQLLIDGNGPACAKGLSHFQDELIRLIFDYIVTHVHHIPSADSNDEEMAIVATGGYGRGLLAPHSDIDLLFLLPDKQTPWVESVAEYILYLLWDLGFKVGHATRNIKQCITLSQQDFTIRTSLLDSRLILGDKKLFEEFETSFQESVVTGTAREFISTKMAERKQRHTQPGGSPYLVEPNIKDGKGGLRDLHTLHWLIKYVSGQSFSAEIAANNTFTAQESSTFKKCHKFLWTVRCHLHFEAGRPEERLSFDLQPTIAKNLRYRQAHGLLAVERFMRHYFMITKDVGELTAILCSNLEIQQLATAPRLQLVLDALNWAIGINVKNTKDFLVQDGRLNVSGPDVFKKDPINIIRFFLRAEQSGHFFHPQAIRLIRQSWRLIDDDVRSNSEANQIFLELLCSKTRSEASLRRMNATGVLGRFIPEFGLVGSMMQFNMYHYFTVDEHLVRTVGQLAAIDNGECIRELPLSTKLMSIIKNRRALYVAALLHDIGKGRAEDHSILGAKMAADICPRLGLTSSETDTVCWLIREHLTMSDTAMRRDLSDAKTIRDFASVVQTPERLNLLLLLTVVDIRAVGPGTWNSWKGQLLRELYYETKQLVSGGQVIISKEALEADSKDKLRERLAFVAPDVADDFIKRQYPEYWLRTDTDKQVQHAKLMRDIQQNGQKLATSFVSDPFKGITKLTILAPHHPGLLAICAGCCVAAGTYIIGGQIASTRDGFSLSTLLLQRGFEDAKDEKRRAERINETIIKVLKGEVKLETLLERRRISEPRISAFDVTPEVSISNTLSDSCTVVEVIGKDRVGLLYELTSALWDLNLGITSARSSTYGEKVIGAFYVTDLTSGKIFDPNRIQAIRDRLENVLHIEQIAA